MDIGTAYVQVAPAAEGLSASIDKIFGGEGERAGQAMGEKSGTGFLKSGFVGAVAGAFAKITEFGISALTQNLDAAISRYDTIQNFPKVMENFGVAGEDAAAAMDKLKSGVKGLPTTIDSAALSVQRLTGATGDVGKATDMYLAFNNAILAGGMPLGEQSAAMEQLSKAMTKGTMNTMGWVSLMAAMPAQLGQVAEAMGFGVNGAEALGEALSSGAVSMEDFADVFIQLNEEGLDGFSSFADQAANISGGIGTSMKNLKDGITDGLASAIGKIDEMAKNNGFPTIADTISTVSAGIGTAFSFIGEIIGRISQTIQSFSESPAGQKMAETFKKLGDAASKFGGPGEIILKIFEGIATFFMGVGAGVLQIINGIREGIERFANSPAGQKLRETFESIQEKMKGIFGEDGPTLLGFLEGLGTVFSYIAEGIAYAITGIMIAVDAVIFGVQWWWENVMKPVAQWVVDAWTAVKTFFTETIPNAINAFVTFFKELPGKIWDVITATAMQFAQWVVDLAQKAQDVRTKVIETVVNFFKELPGKVLNAISNLWDTIKETFTSIPGKVKEGIKKIFEVGKDLVRGMWEGITAMGDWLKEKITSFATGIINSFKSAFGIGSPSRLTAEMGGFLIQGLQTGIEKETGPLLRYLDSVSADIASAFDMSAHIGGMNGNVAFGDVSPAEYKQIIIHQTVKPANTLLDIYNQTKFGVNAAVMA